MRKLNLMILVGVLLISSINIASADITVAPNNYSRHFDNMFTENMGGWDFVENGANFYITMIGASMFWICILIIPYISMYNRQHGVVIVSVTYLFSGGAIAQVLPQEFGLMAMWMVVLSLTGLIYHVFINR